MQKLRPFLIAGAISTVLTLGAVENYKPLLRDDNQKSNAEMLNFPSQNRLLSDLILSYMTVDQNKLNDGVTTKIKGSGGEVGDIIFISIIIIIACSFKDKTSEKTTDNDSEKNIVNIV